MKYSKGFAFIAVIWIVAALAVIGGGAYYASTHSASVETNDEQSAQATTTVDAQLSIKDLFGKNLKCSFGNTVGDMTSKGTAYITGENLRVDAVTTQNGKVVTESHMIKVGSDAYAWASAGAGAGHGAKIKVDVNMAAQDKSKLGVDWDQKFAYDCDQSKFTPPTDVSFMDVSAAFDASVNASGQVNKCGTCDMIPDAAAKAQCKTALGCK
jgi:hypothetical protein